MRITQAEMGDIPQLLTALLDIWEDSVRATHLFLSDAEIKSIREYVPQALGGVQHLIVAEKEPNKSAYRCHCSRSMEKNEGHY